MALDRYDTFLALPPPSASDAWSVEAPNGTPWRVGRNREGFPSRERPVPC
jgi:hypothetical protein